MRRNFVYHLHPLQVAVRTLAVRTTFALGLATLTLFGVLTVTGFALMLYYVPTPAQAYASMLDIENVVTLGETVRLVHRWAAHAMVVTAGLHLLRVWATAAYRQRELNWIIGLGLLTLTLGLAFTGYLLPWDQTSYWAVRVVANMLDHVPLIGVALERLLLGGTQVGPATLVRFYALHVAILPLPMIILAALHLWRVRRDGGLARPGEVDCATVPTWPHLVVREGAVVLGIIAAVTLCALLVDAPLGPPADVLRPSNPEKAPWYFLGLQEMVSYSAVVGGFLFPAALAALLLLFPFLDRSDQEVGRYLGADRGQVLGMAAAATGVSAVAVAATLTPAYADLGPLAQDLGNPAGVMLAYASVAFWAVGWRSGSLRAALRVALAILWVSLLLFTAVGVCRGPDWAFFWPWQEWSGGV
jgi:quinol-cytochrome oxidoreductase complex cytochrome b subunit